MQSCISVKILISMRLVKLASLESSVWVILYLLSLSLRNCRVVRALDMWLLSAHLGHRAGCKLLSHPRKPLDTCSRMKVFHPSPLTKSKSGYTTTRVKDLSVRWLPSTQQKKVCEILQLLHKICIKLWIHPAITQYFLDCDKFDTILILKIIKMHFHKAFFILSYQLWRFYRRS